MANYTPNLNLRKPLTGEYYDAVADHNDAMDKIDLADGKKATKAELREKGNNVLLKMLDETDRSVAIQVLSDSTGNDVSDWVYQLAQMLKADHPSHTIKYLEYDDSGKDYHPEVVLQTGPGSVRYLDTNTGLVCPKYATSKHISGKIDVRAKFSMADWTPALLSAVAGRTGVEGARGWHCGISNVAGRPYFTVYPDGTAASEITMYCLTPPGFPDGDLYWIRWVFTPDDGAGNRILAVYKSNNGHIWELLEAQTVTAGATSFFDNSPTVALNCGGAGGLTAGLKLHEIHIRDGITGDPIAPYLPDLWEQGDDLDRTAEIVGAPVLTIVNGSIPGANIDYLMTADHKHSMTPDYGQIMTFISSSHNEGGVGNLSWMAKLDSIVDFIRAKYPLSEVYLVTQNPEKDTAPAHICHKLRRLDTLKYAKVKGCEVIDVFKAFNESPDWENTLMMDAVHPNASGGSLWAEKVYDQITL